MINFQSMQQMYHFCDYRVNHQSDLICYHNKDMDTLSKRLVDAREKAGLSQIKLAKLAGVAQSVVGMLESGAREKSSYVPLFANILKVSALWLAEGKGNRYDPNNLPSGAKIYILTDEDKDTQAMFDMILSMKKHAIADLKSDGSDRDNAKPKPKPKSNGTEHNNGTE